MPNNIEKYQAKIAYFYNDSFIQRLYYNNIIKQIAQEQKALIPFKTH